MHKNNRAVSQSKIKRAIKNKSRQQRRFDELNKHVNYLCNLSRREQINLEKLSSYQKYSKYFNQDMTLPRPPKQVKYIIDRLVSYQELHK